jgi:hypothetical protein
VLRLVTPRVRGGVAAALLHLRDHTGRLLRVCFTWPERPPLVRLLRFLVLGAGAVRC